MEDKWIRADKLAQQWKMTSIQFVDHLKNDEDVKRNGLIPYNDKLTPIKEVAIGDLAAIYFLITEIMAIEKERYEKNELYRTALQSEDPFDKIHVRPFLRHCGLSDADMDALLTEDGSKTTLPPDVARIKRQLLSDAGQKGGSQPKTKKPILEAVRTFMQENTKTREMSNERIARQFCKKYSEIHHASITINKTTWNVYCKEDCIFFQIEETDDKKANCELKSMKYNTLLNTYIPRAKKAVSPDIQ